MSLQVGMLALKRGWLRQVFCCHPLSLGNYGPDFTSIKFARFFSLKLDFARHGPSLIQSEHLLVTGSKHISSTTLSNKHDTEHGWNSSWNNYQKLELPKAG